jgi:glyceraldehyde-3-phosphate dehydrogenase (NADP+)
MNQMFLGGRWSDGVAEVALHDPATGAQTGTVPVPSPAQLDEAVTTATVGAAIMRGLSADERARLLERIAVGLDAERTSLAALISQEMGKPITEATLEAGRAAGLFRLAAAELTRPEGEVLALDALPGGAGKFGYTVRQPCGIVLAITPFNYPVILAVHKLAPAIAAGNAVILKPASVTPLTALAITRVMVDAGVPPEAIQCVTGPGSSIGTALAADPRIRKISFTGSTAAGDALTRAAGVKRLSLELGGNAPVIVTASADLDAAASSIAASGYANAGQACVSAQRIIVDRTVADDLAERLVARVQALTVGDAADPATQVAGLVSIAEAERVQRQIADTAARGGTVLTGGERDGSVVTPTVVDGVIPGTPMFDQELFGPAVGIIRCDGDAEAVRIANDTPYGLSAAVFTRDVSAAIRFSKAIDAGNVHINWGSLWRSDLMPYGGLKASGYGKEGIRYAMDEMSESKTVVIHGVDG